MNNIVKIEELTFPCVTRKRGKEAAANLKRVLTNEQITVALDGTDMLSLSFLDGLITDAFSDIASSKIIFRSNNSTIIDKLARIAAIRDIVLYHEQSDEIKHIVPQHFTTPKVVCIPSP